MYNNIYVHIYTHKHIHTEDSVNISQSSTPSRSLLSPPEFSKIWHTDSL